MSCLAVGDNLIVVAKGLYIDCYNLDKHNLLNVPIKSEFQNDHITDVVISLNSKYLAIITSISKQLIIYQLPKFEILKSTILPRSASKIRFTVTSDQILVADKSGDVLIYDITKHNSEHPKLLGHLSLLLDVLQTNDSKHVITTDRDEKIRVSCYPNSYNIQTYCLGHKEFVNHIELLPSNDKYLISSSGDGTIKCWNYLNGKLFYNIDTNHDIDDNELTKSFSKTMDEEGVEVTTLPIIHFGATKLNEECSLIVAVVHGYNKLLVYTLQSKDDKIEHTVEEQLPLDSFPAGVSLHKDSIVLYDNVDSLITIMSIIYLNNKLSFSLQKKIQMFKDISFEEYTLNLDTIKVLYKRKFDNVQEYQERKKQRLDKSLK